MRQLPCACSTRTGARFIRRSWARRNEKPAPVADRGLGRLNWAESAPIGVASRRTEVRAKAVVPLRAGAVASRSGVGRRRAARERVGRGVDARVGDELGSVADGVHEELARELETGGPAAATALEKVPPSST